MNLTPYSEALNDTRTRGQVMRYFGWTLAQLDEAAPPAAYATKQAELDQIAAGAEPEVHGRTDTATEAAKPKTFTLTHGDVMVEFTVYTDTVAISTKRTGDKFPRRVVTTREDARKTYAKLLTNGYTAW